MEQRGHLLTLVLPDEMDPVLKKWQWQTLPIEPENHGGWRYKVIEEKRSGRFQTAAERFDAIRKELDAGGYDFIINAGDPDQEGELLIRIVLAELNRTGIPVKRFWCNDTTEQEVLKALRSLRDDDHDPMLVNLLSAAYARQHSDYRVGMNISRAASLKLNSRVACGRVKTPIMAIVCRREIEILNFVPSTVYGVKVLYREGFSGTLFEDGEEASKNRSLELKQETAGDRGDLRREASERNAGRKRKASAEDTADEDRDEAQGTVYFETKEEAERLIASLSGNAAVIRYESKKTQTQPPKLFKLATAQIAAGKLGYSSAKTLEIIQALYEKGYVSYPRTDCEYISGNEDLYQLLKSAMCVPELEPHIKTITNGAIKKVRTSKKWVNDKQLKQAGHSALIPTGYRPDFNSLSKEQQDIYSLICRQFTAIFMPPLIQKKTLLITEINGNRFRSTGKTVVDEGYTKLFGTKFTDALIPTHRAGDELETEGFEPTEKTSSCPKRFTDADLIAVCEAPHRFLNEQRLKSLGRALRIGTPATRAAIIEELISRDKYLQRKKEKRQEYIVPTDEGMRIYEKLKDRKICQVDLTGEWEEKLEQIRNGELRLNSFEEEMRSEVRMMVEDIRRMSLSEDKSVTAGNNRSESISRRYPIVGKCPECTGSILSGPKGFFCSNFRNGCGVGGYKTPEGTDIVVTDEEFERLLKGETVIRNEKDKDSGIGISYILEYDLNMRRINAKRQ